MYSAFPMILTDLYFMTFCAQPNTFPSFEPFSLIRVVQVIQAFQY